MAKTRTRILSMLLAILMVISMVSVFVLPAYADTVQGETADDIPAEPDMTQYVDADPSSNPNVFVLDATIVATSGEYTLAFGGGTYTYTIGTNAFGSIADIDTAVAAAKEAGTLTGDPDIIIASDIENLIVRYPAKFYTQAYATAPHEVGSAVDGSDWVANEGYAALSKKVTYIALAPSLTEGNVEFHGITLKGRYLDGWRKNNTTGVNVIFNNTRIDQTGLTNANGSIQIDGKGGSLAGSYIFTPYAMDGVANRFDTPDTLIIKNTHLYRTLANARLFGEEVTAQLTVFDNLYYDRTNTAAAGTMYIKTAGTDNWFVMKNSNLDSKYLAAYEGAQKNSAGASARLVFDNNIFYKVVRGSGTSSAIFQGFLTTAWTTIILQNNTFIAADSLIGTQNLFYHGSLTADDTTHYGNYINQYNKYFGFKTIDGWAPSSKKLTLFNIDSNYNYFLPTYPADWSNITEEGILFRIDSAASNFTSFSNEAYYYDFDMTALNTDFVVEEVVFGDALVTIDQATKVVTVDATGLADMTEIIYPEVIAGVENITIYEKGDEEKTPVEEIDPSSFEGVKEYVIELETAGYVHEYTMVVITANVVDFNAMFDDAIANGETVTSFELDPANTVVYIPEMIEGDVFNRFFDNVYYSFTYGDYVVGSYEELAAYYAAAVEADPTVVLNIIMPAGEYGNFTVSVPGNYYGANAGINPNVKGETVTDDWTLNTAWGVSGETAVGNVVIAAGLEGVFTMNGFTLRGHYTDTARTTASGTLVQKLINTVVDQPTKISSRSYFFDITNGRSNNTDAVFGETYADEFHVINFRYVDVKSSYRLGINEKGTAVNVFDGIYVNTDAYTGTDNNGIVQQVFGWFKNGTGNANYSMTVKNSMFRGYEDVGLRGTFSFQPQNTTVNYTGIIDNNVFVNANGSMPIIDPTVYRDADGTLQITNNTFFNDEYENPKAIALADIQYLTDADGDRVDDNYDASCATISGNNFIGYNNTTANFETGLGLDVAFEDNFFTLDTENFLTAACGSRLYLDNAEAYNLTFDRTVKSSDIELTAIAKGEAVINGDSNIILLTLTEGTVTAADITATEGAEVAILKDGVASDIVAADIAELGSEYTITVTVDGVTRTYTVNAFATAVAGFDTNPDADLIGAVVVDPDVADYAAGAVFVYNWLGVDYAFTAGVNAFASYADARINNAIFNANAPIKIILDEWDATADLVLYNGVEIYAPNYDTVPYVRGEARDGSDWTENEDYFNNQVIVKSITVDASASGSTVGAYGFTYTHQVNDTKRPKSDAVTTINLVNLVKDGLGGSREYIINPGNANNNSSAPEAADVMNVTNLYVRSTNERARLIGENLAAFVTFDGLYVDGNKAGVGFRNDIGYMKQFSNNAALTFKNCNLRNLLPATANGGFGALCFQGYNVADVAGRTNKLIWENNILYNIGRYGGKNVAYAMPWYCNSYSDFIFTGNYMEMPYNDACENEGQKDTAGFFHSVGMSADDIEKDADYREAIITNNIFNGVSGGIQINSSSTLYMPFEFTVTGNFGTENWTEDLENTIGGKVAAPATEHKVTVESWWYLDIDKTMTSDMIYDMTWGEDIIVDADNFALTAFYTAEAPRVTYEEVWEEVVIETPTTPEEGTEEVTPAAEGDTTTGDGTTEGGETTEPSEPETEMVFKGYKYSIDVTDLVAVNEYGNVIRLYYGDATDKYYRPLTFMSETIIEDTEFVLDVTVASPDETVAEGWSLTVKELVECTDHVFEEYVSDGKVNCYQDGTATAVCTTPGCGATDTIVEKATGAHVFTNYVYNEDATLEADGTETATCDTDGCTATDTRVKEGTKT